MARPLLLTNRRYVFLFSVSLMSYSLFKFKFSVQIIYYLRNNLRSEERRVGKECLE